MNVVSKEGMFADEDFEVTKGVIRIRKSKKTTQYEPH